MTTTATIVGVHPVEADAPVYLIELLVEGDPDGFNIGEVTQKNAGQPKSDWQVPYDERVLEKSKNKTRYAFFFHDLNFDEPLVTPAGPLSLTRPTKVPKHLKDIDYESP